MRITVVLYLARTREFRLPLRRETRRLQQQARQEQVHARTSNISLGDSRLHSHDTSYRVNYAAPLPGTDTLRSPLQACHQLTCSAPVHQV